MDEKTCHPRVEPLQAAIRPKDCLQGYYEKHSGKLASEHHMTD